MLVGLVHPDAGAARALGEDSENLPPQTRGRIAFLAEGHPLYGWMTVAQAVRFTRAFYPTADPRLLDEVLDHFGLSPKARIRHLSKGQRAQVALALAIAPDPELLILDDPTLGLDANVRRDFLESMIHIIQRRGRTILFSSHVLGDVERVADRVGVMIDGVLRVDCPVEHFKRAVRKVTVEFGRQPPDLPILDGLVNQWQIGTRWELVFVGFGPRQRAVLETLGPSNIEILELNLEDAFIEYTRGPRRALTIFGDHDDQSAHDQGAA
jgi:ABC-2 type transport system ATP-binding protein